MHALIFAAVIAPGSQEPGALTRDLVLDVCLPYAADGVADQASIGRAGLRGVVEDGQGDFHTRNQAHLVQMTRSGDAGAAGLRRVCVVQARAGGFDQARDAISGPLESVGFTASPDEPEDWPVWTRGGVTISVHQNPGRATIIRASYSSLDAEGF